MRRSSGERRRVTLALALAIAVGLADAGIGLRSSANDLDLDFIPVTWERFDIVLGVDVLGAARPLIAALRDSSVLAAVNELGATTPGRQEWSRRSPRPGWLPLSRTRWNEYSSGWC
ncbi:MAG: hypothetical protein H0X35_10685 [Pseudonocardiales bacterium]|nr:hypothetical protein [Pseudonocardiales bacterium]